MRLAASLQNRVQKLVRRARKGPVAEKIIDPRFPGKPLQRHATPLGTYFLPADSDSDCIAIDMREGRIFEPEVVDLARKYIRPGTIALDVGSNFGQMALLFSEMVGERGQVVAFEADDFVYSVLRRNLDANGADNVRAYFGAVHEKSGGKVFFPVQDFKRFGAYGSYGIDPNAKGGRSVDTLAIDDLPIDGPVSFMKVDVQGCDLFAMRGAVETIRRHRMPILFEYEEQFQEEFKTSIQDYLDFVRDIGYRVERTVRSINYLIVPDERASVSVPKAQSNGSGAAHAAEGVLPNRKLCEFLRSRTDVDEATRFLQHNGFASHLLACKDWDLARIVPEIGDGNFLDMGSSESYVLKNVMLKRTRGEKYGIDLRAPDVPLRGVRYLVGDLMNVPVADGFFNYVTCLSVIEHEVNFRRFAEEASRLLVKGGKLFITFDYWNPEVRPGIRLYGLAWQPLDEAAARKLLAECERAGLYPVEPVDWTLGDAVIREGYFAPAPAKGISYTFGIFTLEKREATRFSGSVTAS